jgi:hypothetical protein
MNSESPPAKASEFMICDLTVITDDVAETRESSGRMRAYGKWS